jgi:DNA polymerase
MAETATAHELLASVRAYLEELRDTGVDALLFAEPVSAHEVLQASNPPSGAPETLDLIREELEQCGRCALGATRHKLVFGVGSPQARLVFVGEAPGRDEDLQGEPFVGEAGQLLTKIIQAMGFERNEVYICNVLKCRPPNNRNPEPDEIEKCEPFLLRQLQAIGPQAIVCLGTFAAHTLLRSTEPISKLRGRFHDYHGIPLMPTFHPAFLLRNPNMKREVWDDVQKVMKLLGKDMSARKG